MIDTPRVAVFRDEPAYPEQPPYSPAVAYPEYPFAGAGLSEGPNATYAAVRGALHALGLDAERFGTTAWNPLGRVVRPGDVVVLKPNFVRDFRESSPDNADCVITHGAVLRAVADYVYIALKGQGEIKIADAPQNDADFAGIRRLTQLDALQRFYRSAASFDLQVYDLRPEAARKVDGVIVGHAALPGDPLGYAKVNLGERSAFAPIEDLCRLLYGAEYDTGELYDHHRDGRHEYLISRTVLAADVVISVPKLKTHKKVGLTVNLKNLVGINGNKNWLPHHREGTPSQGGDQFADDAAKHKIERAAVAQFKRLFPLLGPLRPLVAGPIKAVGKRVFGDTNKNTIRSGNWYGNDTTWRMTLDLNRILYYADADGRLHDQVARRLFSVVDGIVGGEGAGPLDPRPRPCGVVLAGFNPVAVDLACAQLMGFDYHKIPMLREALADHPLPLARFKRDDVRVSSNDASLEGPLALLSPEQPPFEPHFGWKGHIELQPAHVAAARDA